MKLCTKNDISMTIVIHILQNNVSKNGKDRMFLNHHLEPILTKEKTEKFSNLLPLPKKLLTAK